MKLDISKIKFRRGQRQAVYNFRSPVDFFNRFFLHRRPKVILRRAVDLLPRNLIFEKSISYKKRRKNV